MIMIKEYRTIEKLAGLLLLVKQVAGVKLGELGEIELEGGKTLRCQVIEVNGRDVVVQLLESASEVNFANGRARFYGHGVELGVSSDMLGRVFNGMGDVIDGGPRLIPDRRLDINGGGIDKTAKKCPDDFIRTGISAIDGLTPVFLGQTVSVFSDVDLPHMPLVSQIIRQAKICRSDSEFVFVFAAIGITFEEYELFVDELKKAGIIDRTVLFVNLASDFAAGRISIPRMAMTAAEYLAFELGMQVMVIMSDMTSYADAIREVSASRKALEELKDYPSSLYKGLAAIYERSGKKEGSEGSVTAIPIFISPEDNKASPVFDAAKQLTDVQIVMSRKMHEKGYTPAIDVLSSNSKEMNGGEFASSLITYYARGTEAAARGEAIDKDELLLEEFAEAFEKQYINQGVRENRSMEETLDIGNKLLAMLSDV